MQVTLSFIIISAVKINVLIVRFFFFSLTRKKYWTQLTQHPFFLAAVSVTDINQRTIEKEKSLMLINFCSLNKDEYIFNL